MTNVLFCVCFDVMYSGEYNVFDVTLTLRVTSKTVTNVLAMEKIATKKIWQSNLSTCMQLVSDLLL